MDCPCEEPLWLFVSGTMLDYKKIIENIGLKDFGVCRQVRRTSIEEVNAIFAFLAIPTKLVSESGIKRIHNS